MRCDAYTEEEGSGLLPPGQYSAEIVDAEEKTSKTGKPMFELDVRVFWPERDCTVNQRAWVSPKFMAHRFKHLAEAVGIPWTPGKPVDVTESDLIGKTVRVKIKTRTDPERGAQNEIDDYAPQPSGNPGQSAKPITVADIPDDEIPF